MELHLCKAERAHHQLKEDTGLSKSDPNVMLVTFDLQQSLPTPVLTTNIVFYKRQLWTYNLGVHDCRSGKGYMYVWHEGTASQGSSEIGSCILKHIQVTKPTETHLITFSDSCGGQNRNIYLLALWLHMVASDQYSFTTIDQKFMVVGHSYLSNDRDFGSIETARRRASHLYVPTDWSELIRNCRRKNPFTITDMARNDFVSLHSLPKAFVNAKSPHRNRKLTGFRFDGSECLKTNHCNSDTVIHTIHWKNGRSLILREKGKVDRQTWVAFYQQSFTAIHDRSRQPRRRISWIC